jgi:acyl-CoA thioester hydrolase
MNGDAMSGRLTGAGHELIQRVYFEDTDYSGRVYHARYLQFMERGRSDYLRLLGVHHRELAELGLAFAVRRMTIDFLGPASIDELLAIRSRIVEATGARALLRQKVMRGEAPLVEAEVTIVLLSGRRPVRFTPVIREALEAGRRD